MQQVQNGVVQTAQEEADAAAKKAAEDAAAAQKAAEEQAAAQAAAQAEKNMITGGGVFAHCSQINPGRWSTSGGSDCYYAVLNSPDTTDISTNNITRGPATVDLPAGKFFDVSERCGAWQRQG